jgi:hypothetical protein
VHYGLFIGDDVCVGRKAEGGGGGGGANWRLPGVFVCACVCVPVDFVFLTRFLRMCACLLGWMEVRLLMKHCFLFRILSAVRG